jgi:alpha-maltose-1-phosphate synthase
MKKFKVALIRGAYSNPYELQNYSPFVKNVETRLISALSVLDKNINIETTRLFSPTDITHLFPHQLSPSIQKAIKVLANRTLGDMHLLFNLEKYLPKYNIWHTADPHYYYSYQAAKLKQKYPQAILVSTFWDTIVNNNRKTLAKRRLIDFTKSQIDHYICHTRVSYNTLLSEGINSSKITFIRLGIDTNRFSPKKRVNNRLTNNILFIGRLSQEKGILVLLNSFIALHQKFKNCNLRIVGNGPLKKQIKTIVNKNNLQNSTEITTTPYNQIHKHYKWADIFVLPSQNTPTWEEQYGMVLVEALSSGLPIITTDTGAIPEIVGESSIVIKENNEPELTQALTNLMSNKVLKNELAKKARKRALKYYNNINCAKEVLKLYEKLYLSCNN